MAGPWNTFVEGDNLDVMRTMADESFDVAYLDPPYNTGSKFAYADRRSHDAWTEFMRPRLEEVRRLLKPTGSVWVSIDDHEQARLRLLLDAVFGERQFLAQIVVNLNARGRQLGRGFATAHEYLIVHARDARLCTLDASLTESVDPRDFPQVDADGRRFRLLPLRNTNKRFNPRTSPTLHFPLYGDSRTGRVATTPFDGAEEIWPVFGDGTPAVWRWSVPRVDAGADDLVCRVVRGVRGDRVDVAQRDWWHAGRRKKLTTLWRHEEVGSTDTAVAELKALCGHTFESPKPTGLVRRILATVGPDAAVLDPFAGSGTTGHAVALANVADGGSRTCTSIQSGEPVRSGSRADEAGLAMLADITRRRLQAVDATLGGGLSLSAVD